MRYQNLKRCYKDVKEQHATAEAKCDALGESLSNLYRKTSCRSKSPWSNHSSSLAPPCRSLDPVLFSWKSSLLHVALWTVSRALRRLQTQMPDCGCACACEPPPLCVDDSFYFAKESMWLTIYNPHSIKRLELGCVPRLWVEKRRQKDRRKGHHFRKGSADCTWQDFEGGTYHKGLRVSRTKQSNDPHQNSNNNNKPKNEQERHPIEHTVHHHISQWNKHEQKILNFSGHKRRDHSIATAMDRSHTATKRHGLTSAKHVMHSYY